MERERTHQVIIREILAEYQWRSPIGVIWSKMYRRNWMVRNMFFRMADLTDSMAPKMIVSLKRLSERLTLEHFKKTKEIQKVWTGLISSSHPKNKTTWCSQLTSSTTTLSICSIRIRMKKRGIDIDSNNNKITAYSMMLTWKCKMKMKNCNKWTKLVITLNISNSTGEMIGH